MDQIKMSERLQKRETIYLYDDYEEACVRIFADKKGTHTFIKLKRRAEFERPDNDEKVFAILIDGREITEKEYRTY